MAKKLAIYGFNKKALALFNSYMTNRTQQVQIGNALSNKCPVRFCFVQTVIHLALLQFINIFYPCTIIQFYSSLLGL
jgi:zona occludens toxin (predicted ATPase)